jgi:hypothetical protein
VNGVLLILQSDGHALLILSLSLTQSASRQPDCERSVDAERAGLIRTLRTLYTQIRAAASLAGLLSQTLSQHWKNPFLSDYLDD